MAIEITIPRLGWSMDEGLFGEWLKQEGDRIEPGEPLFTLEGDKALQDIESVDAGILHILPTGPQGGDTVRVGALVGYLLADGEAPPQGAWSTTIAEQPPPSSTASGSIHDTRTVAPAKSLQQETTTVAEFGQQPIGEAQGPIPKRNSRSDLPLISPRAERVARELGVDWTRIVGTGSTGRIREQDVRSVRLTAKHAPTTGNLRRTIARRMLESASTTVPVTLTTRADASQLVELREQFKAAPESGSVPSYQDIISKLVAVVLGEQPVMNCRWENNQLIAPDGIHLGIAVDTESGLLVPVVRNVDRLSIWQLAATSSELVQRARARTCTQHELIGSTFTITNLGAFGIDAFTPVINSPEVAILGIGAIRREAVVMQDDQIERRHIISLSLTFNHCAVDGAPAARFLQRLVRLIEDLPVTLEI